MSTSLKEMTEWALTHSVAYKKAGVFSDSAIYLASLSKAALVDVVLDLLDLNGGNAASLQAVREVVVPRLKTRGDHEPLKAVAEYRRSSAPDI